MAAALGAGPCCLPPRLLTGLLPLPRAGCGAELASVPVKEPTGCAGELFRVQARRAAGGRGAGCEGPLWGSGRTAVLLILEAAQPAGFPAAATDDGLHEPVSERRGHGSQAGLCAPEHEVPVRPHPTQAAEEEALCRQDLPPVDPLDGRELLVQGGQHGVEDAVSLPEQCRPLLRQEAAQPRPRLWLRGRLLGWPWQRGWSTCRSAVGVGGGAGLEASGYRHCGRGDTALFIVLVPPHRDLDGPHGRPAERAAVPQPRPPLDAAHAELMAARDHRRDVSSHVAADGTRPRLCCGHGRLTGCYRWREQRVTVALLHRCCSHALQEEERSHSLTVSGRAKVMPQSLSRKPPRPCSWAISRSPPAQHRTPRGRPGTCPCTTHLRCCGRVSLGPGCLHRAGPGKHERCCGDELWELLQAATGTARHSTAKALLDLQASQSRSARSRNKPD